MSKFVVSGYIGFDNFGDEAIASSLVQKLKREGAEKITLISSNPAKTAKNYDVNSCKMFGFLKPLMDADTLISGGGSLLQDVTSIKSLLYYLGVIFCALLLRKKVIIFAQGIGPINSKIGQFLTKIALKRCNEITVRDSKSQELLDSWGIKSKLVKDPIFEIEIPEVSKNGVGIQLRSFDTISDKFLDSLADEIIKRFQDKEIKIFSLQDSIDMEVCKKFEKLLKEKIPEIKTKILSKMSIKDVINQISGLEYLIGMRFHSNVIGIKANVKTLAINYDIKVQKLAQEYNLPMINLDETEFSKEFDKLIL